MKGIKTLFGVAKCQPTGSSIVPKYIFGGDNSSCQRQNILYLIMIHQYMGNVFNFTRPLTLKNPSKQMKNPKHTKNPTSFNTEYDVQLLPTLRKKTNT